MLSKNREYIILASLFLLVLLAYIFIPKIIKDDVSQNQRVEVRYKDTVIMDFDPSINNKYVIDVALGKMHVEVKDSRYRVYDVDCPNKNCEKIGWVSIDDPTLIVCLPNNIVLVLVSD